MANRHYLYCNACKDVKQISPEPECVHFGKLPRRRNSESSMVIFRNADGKVSIPWEPNARTPKGFVREEVRGARAVRKLERELDARDLQRHRHYQEKHERIMAPINASVRDGLKRQMSSARTQFEKDYVRRMLERLERKPVTSGFDAGNHRSE